MCVSGEKGDAVTIEAAAELNGWPGMQLLAIFFSFFLLNGAGRP
jgi:hypothetical protein